jgi:3-oxoadipate enol-lactonase
MAMATAPDGTRINYETSGPAQGVPVLFIQGLGADHRGWLRQQRAFRSRYRCIFPDNRGVGGSDVPPGPYDLEEMARDLIAVLDAEGIESAHVIGASMGGVLTQILAVRHPRRVRSITLACTACRHHPWREELLSDWARLAEEEGISGLTRSAPRWLVGHRSLRRFSPVFTLLGPLALRVAPEPFVAQVRAILAVDDSLRNELPQVKVPALVITGSQDILTPVGDAEELADLLPNSELAMVRGAAHGFMFEQAGIFNRIVGDFLKRVVRGDGDGHQLPISATDVRGTIPADLHLVAGS